MAQYTPMIQQYLEIKNQVPDAFLFFRLGDFYEMFFEDATRAAEELEITLTGREGGTKERIPMCGVPYHSAETYLARLIEKGYKVAICEQVEDPAQAKGVVKREIVRIVTPGTYVESKQMSEASNNYMVSITRCQHAYGLAACDVSTGELYSTWMEGSLEHVLDEAQIYQPAEMIVDEALLHNVQSRIRHWMKNPVVNGWTESGQERHKPEFLQEESWNGLNEPGQRSVAMLLGYITQTQKRSLRHIHELRSYENDQYMHLDPFTRRNLELSETVRDRSRKGSLLWMLDETVTAMGGRQLKRWLDKPLLNRKRIEERQEAVSHLVDGWMVREDLRQHLKRIYDLERLVGKLSFGSVNARDLHALKVSLQQMPALVEVCQASGSRTLQRLVADLDLCEEVAVSIEETIVEEPPISVKDGGIIRTGCDPYLDQLKEASSNGKQWIAQLEQQERQATGIKSLKIGFNKVFGYYIEVTKANLSHLPEGRYERKQTLSNAERYVTPELKEKEALILEAEEKMVDLEYSLFVQLRDKLVTAIPRLQLLAEKVCEMDVYQSLAVVSAAHQYIRPQLSEERGMEIVEGRHPVVEAMMTEEDFIANDTHLTPSAPVMLITGPNMAGKSTYMRQVAMISIMAQMGCFVPAEAATLSVVDRIFTRIGAADDLVSGQSTFMVEMRDIQLMTAKATARSLVIIDELGRGTSTHEGMAIAQSVIEYLHEHIGCCTLVSTHYHELAHLEETLAGLRNFSMAVKESEGEVTFLRRLVPGAASSSYGIYCAQIAGLPGQIIERAYGLLSESAMDAASNKGAGSQHGSEQPIEQISLFEEPKTRQEPVRKGRADRGAASDLVAVAEKVSTETTATKKAQEMAQQQLDSYQALLHDIEQVELMNMTPLEAMQWIQTMKMKWKKETIR
ncbi:DNA mismatch repair protein MutS [Marinicrinis sediminis]|uniref:DNA mismatch repair protein MutS n=1 Tax=Marinicrinis sediminis TaxID=1652465 RepID=A0ABW5RDX9_9BACL